MYFSPLESVLKSFSKIIYFIWIRNVCNSKADGAVFPIEIPETGFLFSEIHCCEDFSTKKRGEDASRVANEMK